MKSVKMTGSMPATIRKDIKGNNNNPRNIRPVALEKLVKSLIEFPEMLDIREIVIGTDGVSLGGNMRMLAMDVIRKNPHQSKVVIYEAQEIARKFVNESQRAEWSRAMNFLLFGEGYKVKDVSKLSLDKQMEFIIKDNVGYGEWDYDMLANEWDENQLIAWGMDEKDLFGKFEKEGEADGEEKDGTTGNATGTGIDTKHLVFTFPAEQYDSILTRFENVIQRLGLEENEQAFLKMLELAESK